ncbi:MAG: glycine betaine/L-proline ABC transporter ATP-binding protein, partial [Rhodobacteraceae bacterium]|nr:glycine betaine/L-proline ABC transporter ATP-binding protein [Paracoccaceae bacterium]
MVEPMVSMRGLYKIFGARGKDVLHHVQGGMGKEELLARHGHVLGLNNINVDMQAGE